MRTCPLGRYCGLNHILCNCPGLANERDGLAQDLTLTVPPARTRTLAGTGDPPSALPPPYYRAPRTALDRPLDTTAQSPPQSIPTSLHAERRTTHPPAHQHMGHHGRDHPLDRLQGTCPRLGTPAHSPYHPPRHPYGLLRAPRPGHGPLSIGHAGTASAGITLTPTQAPAPRPTPSGTAPTDTAATLPRPCVQ